jgi:hypothetical protein
MSMQTGLTIIGAAVGFALPGVGWALGATIGGMAGSVLFPTDLGTIDGPRLNDLNVQSSAIGAPIPIVYGTHALAGNVIWSSGIIESVSRNRQGGKGGPTQTVRTYSYSVNCAVGICEGEIGAIRRIWADAKLIYDARPQFDGESDDDYITRGTANTALLANTEIYLGTATQEVDPTIESFVGVGNVSAFRDLAYCVFSEFGLEDYGNRIPNFRFEVVSLSGLQCEDVTLYGSEVLYPWDETSTDPRYALGIAYGAYEFNVARVTPLSDASWTNDLSSVLASLGNGGATGVGLRPYVEKFNAWSSIGTPNHTDLRPCYPVGSELWTVYGRVNHMPGTDYNCIIPLTVGPGADATSSFMAAFGYNNVVWWSGDYTSGGTDPSGYWVADYSGTSESAFFGGWSYPGSIGLTTGRLQSMPDNSIAISRQPVAPPGPCYGLDAADLPGYCVSGEGEVTEDLEYTLVSGTCKVLQALTATSMSASGSVTKYPLGPALPLGHAQYNDSAFWTAAYDDAVTAGDMPGGLTYGVDYPVVDDHYYAITFSICSIDSTSVTLGSIVRDICERCDLAPEQIDVTDLTELVDGYVIGRPMAGKDAIGPLRSYGWFDCVESDGVLKWPTRGKAAVATLTANDLAAHLASEQRPPSVETERAQEVDLPRRLRVHYAQTEKNYEPGEQSASRLSVGTVEVHDIEVAIAMNDTKAAQIADVLLYDAWVSRNRHRIILDQSFVYLEPADAITAPIDGRQERLRVVSVDHALPGLLRIEAVRDDDGVYTSYAIGAPTLGSGGTGGTLSTVGSGELVLLDIPALQDEHSEAGYYAALRSTGTTFSGAVLYRSGDGGSTYSEVSQFTSEATIGTIATATPGGPSTIVDEGNEITVTFDDDDPALESITDAGLLSGLNAAAIGAQGRWEIIQFRTAVQGSPSSNWTLSGLLRGRRGTEQFIGTAQAGDSFVLLDAAIARVPQQISGIGITRLHKGVLVGQSIADVDAQTFTGTGVALKPFYVVGVEGARSGGDLTITFIRRGRLGQELRDGSDIPLSEETESYDCEIIDADGETVLRTLTSATQSFTYTAAQQQTDFGSPQPDEVTVRIYQRSAVVGRGYQTEATV